MVMVVTRNAYSEYSCSARTNIRTSQKKYDKDLLLNKMARHVIKDQSSELKRDALKVSQEEMQGLLWNTDIKY